MYRCRLLLSISVVVLILAFVGAVQAANLVQNPGFDANGGSFDSWTVWTWNNSPNAPNANVHASINTADYHSSTASAEFGNVDYFGWGGWTGGSGAFQEIAVDAGGTYSISAYGKGTTTNGASGIDLIFFNTWPTEEVQDPPNIGRFDLQFGMFGAPDANGWRYGLLTAVAPNYAICMKFEVNNNGDPHNILFDDVVGIPEPATIALLGLGGLALIRKKR